VKFPEDVIFSALDKVKPVMPPDDHPKARVAAANKGFILDYELKKMRRGVTQDAINAIIVSNALPNITIASAGVVVEDVPAKLLKFTTPRC